MGPACSRMKGPDRDQASGARSSRDAASNVASQSAAASTVVGRPRASRSASATASRTSPLRPLPDSDVLRLVVPIAVGLTAPPHELPKTLHGAAGTATVFAPLVAIIRVVVVAVAAIVRTTPHVDVVQDGA